MFVTKLGVMALLLEEGPYVHRGVQADTDAPLRHLEECPAVNRSICQVGVPPCRGRTIVGHDSEGLDLLGGVNINFDFGHQPRRPMKGRKGYGASTAIRHWIVE